MCKHACAHGMYLCGCACVKENKGKLLGRGNIVRRKRKEMGEGTSKDEEGHYTYVRRRKRSGWEE